MKKSIKITVNAVLFIASFIFGVIFIDRLDNYETPFGVTCIIVIALVTAVFLANCVIIAAIPQSQFTSKKTIHSKNHVSWK